MSGADVTVAQIVAALSSTGLQIPAAMVPPEGGGLYAWWVRMERLGDAKPNIPFVPHPTAADWSLLYVGIVPHGGKMKTKRSFRDRVRKDHRSGSIGNSSFRQSLGSLLISHLGLRPNPGFDRSRFVDERMLTLWIEDHCAVAFAPCSRPWLNEHAVIDEMRPPLNIVPGSHEFRHTVQSARDSLRNACGLSMPKARRHRAG